MAITKTVDGHFGPKQVTRAEFVELWSQQVVQFWHIATTGADADKIDTMLLQVKEMAGAKWDKMS